MTTERVGCSSGPFQFLVDIPKTQSFAGARFLLFALICVLTTVACSRRSAVEAVYGKSGQLELLKYDSNNDGKPDTFSYMRGGRIVRIEIDTDEDGKIDRWEYYDNNQVLEKVGLSQKNDGTPDVWSYPGPDGSTRRVDFSSGADAKVTRSEYYEAGALIRVEEDTDGDGAIDKWQVYDGGHLTAIAFDTLHRGSPDRRIVYAPDGSSRVEVDVDGSGHFESAPASGSPGRSGR